MLFCHLLIYQINMIKCIEKERKKRYVTTLEVWCRKIYSKVHYSRPEWTSGARRFFRMRQHERYQILLRFFNWNKFYMLLKWASVDTAFDFLKDRMVFYQITGARKKILNSNYLLDLEITVSTLKDTLWHVSYVLLLFLFNSS